MLKKELKKVLLKWAGSDVPPNDVLIVVYDGKSARLAAERTVEYAVSNERRAWIVSADSYEKYRSKVLSNRNKVIVIGHHDTAEREKLKAACKYGECHGMTYGTSDRMCVLRAKRKDLHSKSEFIVLPLKKPCNIRRFRLSNPQTVCTFPCFFPYGLKQGKVFYSPLTTLSSSRAELRFASLVEWA